MDPENSYLYDKRAKLYRLWVDDISYYFTSAALKSVLPQSLPDAPRVLDLGCGTGTVAKTILEKYPNAQFIGFDESAAMLAEHQWRFPTIPLLLGDFNQPNNAVTFPGQRPFHWPSGSFDLIVSAGAVSEYGKASLVIPWLHQLLADGGFFINIGINDSWLGRLAGRLWQFTPVHPTEYAALCRAAGFSNIELIAHKNFLPRLWGFVISAQR